MTDLAGAEVARAPTSPPHEAPTGCFPPTTHERATRWELTEVIRHCPRAARAV